MSDPLNDKTPFSFKKFLEDNTSLLTVFAIFNALIVFSVGIKENEIIRNILTVCFWIFSLLAFFELAINTISIYKFYRLDISWDVRLKLTFFLYAVIFTQLSLIAYFVILYPFVVGYLIAGLSSIGFLVLLMWLNVSVDSLILKMKEKQGWSDRTVRVLKKINNWSLLALILLIGVVIIYFGAGKS